METILNIILTIVKGILQFLIKFAQSIVSHFVIVGSSNFATASIIETWGRLRNFSNILFILLIFAIAVLNLFSDWVDSYTIKKLLPRLLLAIILVNLSLFICRVVVDFADILSSAFLNLSGADLQNVAAFKETQNVLGQISAAGADIAAGIIAILMALIGVIAILLTVLMLLVRIAVIWFLVLVSPLAFVFWVLPQTQSLFEKWWQQFIKYVFMGPAICLLLGIGEVFIKNISASFGSTQYLGLIFSSSILLIAAALPMSMGGAIMAKVAGYGKKAWGYSGAKAVARGKEEFATRMGEQRGIIGKTLGRLQTERGRARREALASKAQEPIYANYTDDHLNKLAYKKDQMAIQELARRGRYDLLRKVLSSEEARKSLKPHVRNLIARYDPILAGLDDEEIKQRLDSGFIIPEDLGVSSISGLLDKGILSPIHIRAIGTRGSSLHKQALVNYYSSPEKKGEFGSLDSTTQQIIFNNALSEATPEQGQELLSQLNEDKIKTLLQNTSASQLSEWEKSGVLNALRPEIKRIFQDWASSSENISIIRGLYDKGKISNNTANLLGIKTERSRGTTSSSPNNNPPSTAPPPA